MLRLTLDPGKSWWTRFRIEFREHLQSFIDPSVVAAVAMVGLIILVISCGVILLSVAFGR